VLGVRGPATDWAVRLAGGVPPGLVRDLARAAEHSALLRLQPQEGGR
jgi:hypothetical protein